MCIWWVNEVVQFFSLRFFPPVVCQCCRWNGGVCQEKCSTDIKAADVHWWSRSFYQSCWLLNNRWAYFFMVWESIAKYSIYPVWGHTVNKNDHIFLQRILTWFWFACKTGMDENRLLIVYQCICDSCYLSNWQQF